jgi:hypothetical protein
MRTHCIALSAVAVLTAALSATPVAALDIGGTLEFCAELTGDRDAVTTQLTELGWVPESDPNPIAGEILLWGGFARAYALQPGQSLVLQSGSDEPGKQLGFIIENASFMAASVLGNSALSPNQPSFTSGAHRLATLGVELGEGYCVWSGPSELQDAASSWADDEAQNMATTPFQTVPDRPGIALRSYVSERAIMFIHATEPSEISRHYAAQDASYAYSNRAFDLQIFDTLPATLLQISRNPNEVPK